MSLESDCNRKRCSDGKGCSLSACLGTVWAMGWDPGQEDLCSSSGSLVSCPNTSKPSVSPSVRGRGKDFLLGLL